MPVVAAAAVPAAAALVADLRPPPARDRDPAAGDTDDARGPCSMASLRAAVTDVLDSLPPFEVALLLAAGSEPLLHAAPVATATPQGGRPREGRIGVDETLLMAIARRGQAPRAQSSRLGGSLGTLALALHDARPEQPLVPLTVAARADADALEVVAVGITGAIAATGQDVAVIAAGDLANAAAAGDDLARRWDDHAAPALAMGDHATLRSLGPSDALAAGAEGWAPLTVLSAIVGRATLRITRSSYLLSGGIGRFTALAEPLR